MRNRSVNAAKPLSNEIAAWKEETGLTYLHIPLHETSGSVIALDHNIAGAAESIEMDTAPASPWGTVGELTVDGSQVISTDGALFAEALAPAAYKGGWMIISAWVVVTTQNNTSDKYAFSIGAITGGGTRGGLTLGINAAGKLLFSVQGEGTGAAADQTTLAGGDALGAGTYNLIGAVKLSADGLTAESIVGYVDGTIVNTASDWAFDQTGDGASVIPANLHTAFSVGHGISTVSGQYRPLDGTLLTGISDITVIAGAGITDAQATTMIAALAHSRREFPRQFLGL